MEHFHAEQHAHEDQKKNAAWHLIIGGCFAVCPIFSDFAACRVAHPLPRRRSRC